MTWLGDTNTKPKDDEREKLLTKRDKLVKDIEALKAAPMGRSQAAINGRQEDLLDLAKKITSIDKKLGR